MQKRTAWIVCLGVALAAGPWGAKDLWGAKDKEDKTQQLKLPDDPPLVALGEANRLVFHVTPLSGKGLLSEQTRDALKALQKLNGGAQIVHLRAFSAGNGDLRRIPQIVAEVLGTKHGPLPSVSVVQAGDLPLGDAQIVLEAISVGKKDTNRDGLSFYPLEVAADPRGEQKELLQKALGQLAAKMDGKAPLAVTCYVSMIDEKESPVGLVQAKFPGAAVNLVQPRRLAWDLSAGCEGVARGGGGPKSYAFTGTQIGLGSTEKDATNAVQRVDRALSEAGAPRGNGSLVRLYLASPAAGKEVEKQVQTVSMWPVEGAGSATGAFAIDAVVPVK